jgi:hypothetical protein
VLTRTHTNSTGKLQTALSYAEKALQLESEETAHLPFYLNSYGWKHSKSSPTFIARNVHVLSGSVARLLKFILCYIAAVCLVLFLASFLAELTPI